MNWMNKLLDGLKISWTKKLAGPLGQRIVINVVMGHLAASNEQRTPGNDTGVDIVQYFHQSPG